MLHDSIFSVAMSLPVLDVRLADGFHPADGTCAAARRQPLFSRSPGCWRSC
jgi:hypothetical protein